MARISNQCYSVLLLSPAYEKNKFNDVTKLFYLKYHVESYRNRGYTQCHVCHRFDDGSKNCGHSPFCVKSSGDHIDTKRTKTRVQEPKYCNCNRAHTSNYRFCPHYMQLSCPQTNELAKPKSNSKPLTIYLLLLNLNSDSVKPWTYLLDYAIAI